MLESVQSTVTQATGGLMTNRVVELAEHLNVTDFVRSISFLIGLQCSNLFLLVTTRGRSAKKKKLKISGLQGSSTRWLHPFQLPFLVS